MRPPPHREEPARLSALRSYGVLDTPLESDFDEIAQLAAQICGVPIALITLIDEERQWFKARFGTSLVQTSRDDSFCGHTILQNDIVVVPDATLDPRFHDNPFVTGDPYVRFYAGMPLETPEGLPLGTLCVLDTEPRDLSKAGENALKILAKQIMAQLELRRQARAIASERREQEAMMDRAEVATWRLDLGKGIVSANALMRRFFGISTPDAPLSDYVAAIHPDDRDRVHDSLAEVQKVGGRYEIEHRIVVGERERWVLARGEAELDAKGSVGALSGVLIDITERKRTQTALETERHRFRELLDEVPAHVVTMRGHELRYEFVNQAFQNFIGEEVTGKTLEEAWPEVPPAHLAMLRSIMETGKPFAGKEAPVSPPKDPSKLGYFDFIFQPLREADDSISGIFVHSADVTEKVLASRALAEERAHLDRTLANAEVATFDWDPVGDHVYANPLLQRFFGVDEEAASGGAIAGYLSAIHEEDRERVGAAIGHTLATGEPFESEYRVRGADGRERWVLARGDAALNEEGKAIRLAGVLFDITIRKGNEAERERLLLQVEAERRKLEMAFTDTPAFICLLKGMDLVFDFANPPYYQLIGHRDVIGKRLEDALPEIPEQGFLELLRNVIRTGEVWNADEVPVKLQRQTGAPLEERILNLRYSPVREADGSISGVYSHAIDVTDQVLARRKLAESEERFRLGQRAGRVGTFEWLIPQNKIVWSPELEALYGEPEGAFEGKFENWVARIDPEDAKRVLPQFEGAMARKERELAYEFRAVLPNGDIRWLAAKAEFDYDENGNPLRMAGVNVDIADRKRAESALRASEQRFRIVAQATRDAVWDWNLRESEVWWNEGISDLFGYAREAIDPSPDWWIEQIHPDDRERVTASIHHVIEHGGANWHEEYRFRHADGHYLTVDDRGYAVTDETGRAVRMVGAMTDVTQERREAARLVFLRDLTEATVDLDEPKKIVQTAVRMLAEHLQVSRCAYAEVEPDENTFTAWDWSRDLPSSAGVYRLDDFGAESASLIRSGQVGVSSDIASELSLGEGGAAFVQMGVRAIVVCPLVKEGRLAAMMALHQSEPRPWREDEIALLQQVADRMWAEIERARAETALRQNAEQLQTIFDNAADDAIVLMDPYRRIIAWNHAAERICGWSAEEAIGRRSGLIFVPEERAAGEPQRKADVAARDGKIFSERWYQRKDGSRFWGSGTMTALRNPDGTVRGFLKMFRDITAKHRELTTLAFLQRLTDAVRDLREPQPIIDVALRLLGEHLKVNRCAYADIETDEETAHILGNWRSDAIDITGDYAVTAWGTPVADILRAGGTFVANDIAQTLEPEDGGDVLRSIGIESVICTSIIKDGKLAGAVAVHQSEPRTWTEDEIELVEMVADRLWAEIERARAEKQLRDLNEDLETRVAERTEQLQAAIKESEAFNYSISHDLRAPLRSIVATSRILLEDLEDSLDREHLQQLERQAHNATRLGVLIDELLRLSRLGRVEVHRSEIDMTELVEDMVGEMERAGMTRGCRFEIQPGMKASADPRLVRLVYSNLLENACKFSPELGWVRIGCTRNGNEDVFWVKDEGVGFDMAYAHKLFLPFERLVTEAEFPGTGIGLANVERIVRRHHGQVWAESEPGKGASFFFTLA